MSKTIWKFPIEVADVQKILMPVGAKVLTVQEQNSIPCIWALVDPEADREIRFFEMFGTGHPILYSAGVSREYISTFQVRDDSLVFHVFEYTGV